MAPSGAESMIQKTVLPNGIPILTELIPTAYSISLGIWVKVGSRDEQVRNTGISHFIEHLLFKGTKRRTALEISRAIESVGGILNAFTGREYTCFYAKVLDQHLDLALDILSDIFLNSKFNAGEVERERNVILQEISMVEDTPEELVHDLFNCSFWGGHALGRPVLGSSDNIRRFRTGDLKGYFRERFLGGPVLITAAGNCRHEEVVRSIEKITRRVKPKEWSPRRRRPTAHAGFHAHQKPLEQVHLCIGARARKYSHPSRFAFYILNTILGGGMSSRLFQEIREKRGLAYSVYSYISSYVDAGLFGIYAGVSEKHVREVLDLILIELRSLRDRRINKETLRIAKEQLKGNLLLSNESTDSRMSRLAKNEIYFRRYVEIDEVLSLLDKVTPEEVQEAARDAFGRDGLMAVLLGNIRPEEFSDSILEL